MGQASMYGNPERQTVGGAVVSFLLRPCAFMGLVVLQAEGYQPTFTSYKSWTGHSLESRHSGKGWCAPPRLRPASAAGSWAGGCSRHRPNACAHRY